MSAKIAHLRQFILIDHSLKDLGGHHFPYALSVLQAAAAAGLRPVLATNASFHQPDAFDARWPLHAVFRNRGYSRHTLDTQSPVPSAVGGTSGPLAWLRSLWRARARGRLALEFASDCAQLFAKVPLATGDMVFLATASELDLAGLALYLRDADLPPEIDWHLQFHFGVFRARPPQYPLFANAEQAMRSAFSAALATAGAARLHFYCTTDPLTLQYQRLGVGTFSTLPYPVHALFSGPHARPANPQPVRIACLGHGRREKGQGQLPELLRALWQDYFKPGRAQLVVQTQRPALRRVLMSTVRALGSHDAGILDFASAGLGLTEYAALLRSCDVGLLLYDSARYYDRCSGVLLELLTAGVPVVVPGGCWLGEQLAPGQQRYLKGLHQQLRQQQRLRQLPLPVRTFELGVTGSTEFSVSVSGLSSTLLLHWRWLAPQSSGTFLRIDCMAHDAAEHGMRAVQIAGRNPDDDEAWAIFRVLPGARATLRFSNAYQGERLSIAACSAFEITGEAVPLGAAGLALGELSLAGGALSDIIDHITHYKYHAALLAQDFARHYNAPGVVAQLLAASTHH